MREGPVAKSEAEGGRGEGGEGRVRMRSENNGGEKKGEKGEGRKVTGRCSLLSALYFFGAGISVRRWKRSVRKKIPYRRPPSICQRRRWRRRIPVVSFQGGRRRSRYSKVRYCTDRTGKKCVLSRKRQFPRLLVGPVN